MTITKKQFDLYEMVRRSGITNMFDINKVSQLSQLDKNTILLIMKNYSKLSKKYSNIAAKKTESF